MAKYLLDSETVSDFYDKYSTCYPHICRMMSSLKDQDSVFISILTLYELEYGYANAPEEKKNILRQRITEAQQDFKVLSLSSESAVLFGELKKAIRDSRGLKKENLKKHNIDIILASVAITENCMLISNDMIYSELRKFRPELKWRRNISY